MSYYDFFSKGGKLVNRITVIIPTLNPCDKIYNVVNDARSAGFERIIIVNDGSREDCAPIFEKLEYELGCTVLTHEVNRGKGAALKTALTHFKNNAMGQIGVVTLDDDGQHTIADTVRVCNALVENPDNLILGVRDFDLPNVPKKSRFGNKITAAFMKLLCSVDVSDTQTGLRAIPLSAVDGLLEVKGDRFEYETNMLLATNKLGIKISEVVIETVYHDNNSGTHFHPIRDSFRIYKLLFVHAFFNMQFLMFLFSSVGAFIIDYLVYYLLINTLPIANDQILGTVAFFPARAVSSVFNFFTNKLVVFKDRSGGIKTAVRYYILCLIQVSVTAFIAGGLLSRIAAGNMLLLWKLLTECVVFVISFSVQRKWVFCGKTNKK